MVDLACGNMFVVLAKSCHAYQTADNPNQGVPVAHWKPLPFISESYERIVIDCVRYPTKARSRNQNLITLIFTFPSHSEAFPLKSINVKNTVKMFVPFIHINRDSHRRSE